jgi:predicted MFS family arabinose efflux permease
MTTPATSPGPAPLSAPAPLAPEARSGELYAVILLASMALFLFADQNLMAPNLTQIATEFGMTPAERDAKLGGEISLWFWMLGAVAALGIGYLTDRVNRTRVLAAVVFLGEIPCFLTGFAETYEQFFWLRALTGLGIGGVFPLIYSLIGDYFQPRMRAAATAAMGLAMGLGVAGGQLLAGFLGPAYGWRLPFLIVGAPNFVLALVFLATIREPPRGRTEAAVVESGHAYSARITWAGYKQLFRVPTNLLVFVQDIFGTVPWGVFFVYLNDFLAQEKGYTVQAATLIVMAIGGASIFGGFIGGLIGNRLYNRHPRYLPLLCGVTTLIGVLPTAVLIAFPARSGADPSALPLLLTGAAAGFTVAMTSPNVRAILLNVNPPETRGSIFALYNLFDDLGRGLGPFVISVFILSWGRERAFQAANLMWVVCGLLLLVMARTFPRDEVVLAQRLREKARAS